MPEGAEDLEDDFDDFSPSFSNSHISSGSYTSLPVFKALQPYFFSLKLAGLFHKKDYGITHPGDSCKSARCCDDKKDRTDKKKVLIYPSQCYAHVLAVIIFCNTIKNISVILVQRLFTETLIILMVTVNTVCVASFIFFLRASHLLSCFPSFFMGCNKLLYFKKNETVGTHHLRRSAYLYCIMFWSVTLVGVAGITYNIFSLTILDATIYPMQLSDQYAMIYVVYELILSLYQCAAWFGMMILHFAICKILCSEFNLFNERLRHSVNMKEIYHHKNLEIFSAWHMQICHLVGHADNILHPFTGAFIASSIVTFCLEMYSIIWFNKDNNGDLVMFAINIFWTLFFMFLYGMVCIGSALVNSKVSNANFTILLQ